MSNLARVKLAFTAAPVACTVVDFPRVLGIDIDHRGARTTLFFSDVDDRIRFHLYISQSAASPIDVGGEFSPAATPLAVAWLLDALGVTYSPTFATVIDAAIAVTAHLDDCGITVPASELDYLLEELITADPGSDVYLPKKAEFLETVTRYCEVSNV